MGDVEGVARGAVAHAATISGDRYLECVGRIHAYGRQMAAFLNDHDVLLTPTLAEPPARIGRFAHDREDYVAYRTGEGGVFSYSPFTAAFNASGPARRLPAAPRGRRPPHRRAPRHARGGRGGADRAERPDRGGGAMGPPPPAPALRRLIRIFFPQIPRGVWGAGPPALAPRAPFPKDAPMNAPAVEVASVRKSYPAPGGGTVRALGGVSLAVARGAFFTLLGPSGCGKTTLLRLIAGFETPDAGRVLIGGRDVTAQPPSRRPVNTVFQSYALFPHLSVARNVGFGLAMQGRPRAEVAATTERMLALVRLEGMAGRKPAQLSGGQQQRVALARALAPAPEVLLLDEPLSALDLVLRREMQRELKRLQHETGITFVFVTHDQEEALTMSDRIAVMDGGEVLQEGTPREIYDAPESRFVAGFIGETNFLTGRAERGGVRLPGGPLIEAAGLGAGTGATRSRSPCAPSRSGWRTRRRPAPSPRACVSATFEGTDTRYLLALPGGQEAHARVPSVPGAAPLEAGAAAGLLIAPGAARPVAP